MSILLNQLIDSYKGLMTDTIPAAMGQELARELAARRASNWLKRAPKAGRRLPDLALGSAGRLSDWLRQGPLLLKFYRGRWCPFCTLELRAWQKMLPRVQALGANLLAVAAEPSDEIALTRERDQLTFEIVADPGCRTARELGIAYQAGPAETALYRRHAVLNQDTAVDPAPCMALPALFLIDTDRSVRFAHVNADTSVRAEPLLVVELLEQLMFHRIRRAR